MKVSNSPKSGNSNTSIKNGLLNAVNGTNGNGPIIVDALEDDLVKRYEVDKKEKGVLNGGSNGSS